MYANALLEFVGAQLVISTHLGILPITLSFVIGHTNTLYTLTEYYLTWVKQVLDAHGRYLKDHSQSYMPVLRTLQKHITYQQSAMQPLCEQNRHSLAFLASVAERASTSTSLGAIESIQAV